MSNNISLENINSFKFFIIFNSFKIRYLVINEKIWFITKDVCEAFEIKNGSDLCKKLLPIEKLIAVLYKDHDKRLGLINESAFQFFINNSPRDQSEIRVCNYWILNEIFPCIKSHGIYPQLKLYDESYDSSEDYLSKETSFYNAVNDSSKINILFRDFAKILTQNFFDIGQNRLFDCLVYYGFIIKRNAGRDSYYVPHQKYSKMGIFHLREVSILNKVTNDHMLTTVVSITPKGQTYLYNFFLENKVKIMEEEILWNRHKKQTGLIKTAV